MSKSDLHARRPDRIAAGGVELEDCEAVEDALVYALPP